MRGTARQTDKNNFFEEQINIKKDDQTEKNNDTSFIKVIPVKGKKMH